MKKNPVTTSSAAAKPAQQRTLKGVVTSDRMNKTRVVSVSRMKKHALYHKYYKVTSKFKAHDEENAYHNGDQVVIRQVRPLSRDKRWMITGKVEARTVSSTQE